MRKLVSRSIAIRVAVYGSVALGLSCGPSHPRGSEVFEDAQDYGTNKEPPKPFLSCSVVSAEGGAHVVCPDGSNQFILNGKDGAAGTPGEAGSKGDSGKDGAQGANGSDGLNGEKGEQGVQGNAGTDGKDGKDGAAGADGYSLVFLSTSAPLTSCSAGGTILLIGKDLNRNGVLDLNPMEPNSDGPSESLIICNGLAGADGKDGQDGATGATGATGAQGPQGPAGVSTNIGFIDPCGDKAGVVDEVLLKIPDGVGGWLLLASVSDDTNGKNTRLSILPNGNYMTTDNSSCFFKVVNGNVTDAHY